MPLVRSRPFAGLATLGAVALIAGCGGGGSGTLSADEFRQQADAICADANTRIAALTEPSADDQILGFLQAGLPIQQEQLQKLKDLEPPDDLAGTFDEATGLLDQQLAAVASAADRIGGGGDPAAVVAEAQTKIQSLNDQADAKAKELGLTVCGTEDTAADTGTTGTTATAPSTETTPPATDTTASTGPVGEASAYLTDVQAAAAALTEFGNTLQGTTSLDDLKANVPEAKAALDTFDEEIAKLEDYTLSNAQLDQQRARLAETGPKVSDVLRRFLDAAADADIAAVQQLLPEVTSTISEFQAAATGG
jgi:hypothetical protein